MTAGQEVLIKNSDETLHNFHARLGGPTVVNVGMPAFRKEFRHTFHVPGVYQITCDVYAHMRGYIVVFEPGMTYTVTAADGSLPRTAPSRSRTWLPAIAISMSGTRAPARTSTSCGSKPAPPPSWTRAWRWAGTTIHTPAITTASSSALVKVATLQRHRLACFGHRAAGSVVVWLHRQLRLPEAVGNDVDDVVLRLDLARYP